MLLLHVYVSTVGWRRQQAEKDIFQETAPVNLQCSLKKNSLNGKRRRENIKI